MTLYEFLSTEYMSIGRELTGKAKEIIESTSFDNLLRNDSNCVELIEGVLEVGDSYIAANRNRASHILVTWLLGVGICRKMHIDYYYNEFGIDNKM